MVSHLDLLSYQAIDALPLSDLPDFQKVKKAILQILNINPEAYRIWLQKVEFSTDYQPYMVAHQIKSLAWKWLCPLERAAEEVAEKVCIEHFVAFLPYKPKQWVTCHQPHAMGVLVMEAYMSAEAGIYLKKNLQRQAA